jgi:hypothetical protein
MSKEYSNTASSYDSQCNFANMKTYNGMQVNLPKAKPTSGMYIVPTWAPIQYDSLTSKNPSCSGYSSIASGYGDNSGNCKTEYKAVPCMGGNRPANE